MRGDKVIRMPVELEDVIKEIQTEHQRSGYKISKRQAAQILGREFKGKLKVKKQGILDIKLW